MAEGHRTCLYALAVDDAEDQGGERAGAEHGAWHIDPARMRVGAFRQDQGATTSAARPKVTSNQKIPRQLHAPTSVPPRTGPSASENPDIAAQTRASGC